MPNDQIGSASIGLSVDSTGVDAGLNQMDASVTRVERSLGTLGRRGGAAIEEIGAGAGRANTTVTRATRSITNEIQRVTAVAEAGTRGTREYYEALASQRGINVDTLRPYLDRLEEVRRKQQQVAETAQQNGSAYDNTSQSVAQLNANLRNVPAQLTDIVAGLQGGQNPFTILLQQGGQLTDMFGGVQQAASALGGYIRSLITPVTAVAAAVALLAVAYYQGSKEVDAYNLAIIKTGNAAGVTAGQLNTMAAAASKVAGTQGANAAALAALVSTGQVGAEQLLKATTATVQAQKFLGQSVEETAGAYADLGKDPLAGILKLNEGLNFLNFATYKQIQDLQEQGKVTEAAKLAQNTYSEALTSSSKKIGDSLGSLQKSWNFLGTAAKSAWDFMLDVGREDTLDDKLKRAQERLDRAKAARYSFIGSDADKARTQEEAQNDVDRIQRQIFVNKLTAERTAEEKKRFDAQLQFDQEGDKYLARREQMTKEITRVTNLAKEAKPVGLDADEAAEYEKNVQTRIAQIRASFADVNNAGIESQIANLERLGDAQEEAARRAFIPVQRDQDAGLNSAADKQIAFMEKVAKFDEAALVNERARLQQRLALTAQLTVSEDQQASKQKELADIRAQIGTKDQQILTRRAQLQADLFVQDVNSNRAAIKMLDDLLDARTADADALERQLQAQKDENETIGLTRKQLQELVTQRVEERAVRLESNADIIETIVGREAEAEAMRKSARLLRELNQEQIKGANKTQQVTANKSFWESVDSTAQKAFTNIFEGGDSVAKRLKDSFKAGVLDILYQITIKKWIIDISTSMSGQSLATQITSALGSGGTSASGSGFLGTASNLFSIGKTIYQGFSTGVAASLGTQIANLGNLFGSQAVSAFGTGLTLTSSQAATAAAAYGGTGTTVGAGLSAGASAASAIPIIGWIIAGMAANDSFYKQGFRMDGQANDITESLLKSTLKGNFFGPLLATAGVGINAADTILTKLGLDSRTASLFSGSALFTKAFGRSAPRLEGQGIEGTISSSGINANTFANILEKGGWFRSDKRYTNRSALSSDVDADFDTTISTLISSVKGFGTAIGAETKSIDNYTKQFKISLTGNAEEDQKTINALFSGVADEVATILVPSIKKFSTENETAAATLQRLSTDYTVMNAALGAIGISFGAVGVGSLEAREKMIALTGGLDSFVSQAEFFSQNFLSETERNALLQKQLTASFADLGITAVPKTRDEFKALVQGLNLTTDSGQKTYAGLMNLQQVFAILYPEIDQVAIAAEAAAKKLAEQREQRTLDIQLMEALGNSEGALAATRADSLAALLTDQARITQQQIYAAQDAKKAYDALVSVADGALSRLTESINAEKDRINTAFAAQQDAIRAATQAQVDSAQESLKAAQTQASAIETVFSALNSALGSTQIESEAATIARRQTAQATLSAALSSKADLANNSGLMAAIGTITSQSNERLFGTFEEYARDQARTNNSITFLRDAAGEQVDYAKLTIEKMTEQIEAIKKAGEADILASQQAAQAQIDALDKQLAADQLQLDALKGIDSRVLGLTEANALFAEAIKNLLNNPTAGKNLGSIGLSADTLASTMQAAAGASVASVDAAQVQALIARASDPAQNAGVLLDEIKRLNDLIVEQNAKLDAISNSTGTTATTLNNAARGGQPFAVTLES